MLACAGCFIQELWHPLCPSIGGLAVTHMDQLHDLSIKDGILNPFVNLIGNEVIGITSSSIQVFVSQFCDRKHKRNRFYRCTLHPGRC